MVKTLFLEAMARALEGNQVSWEQELSAQQLEELFRLAGAHHVLPMVYEAVFACPSVQRMDGQMLSGIKRMVHQQVMVQVRKTAEFLELYQGLTKRGLAPILVKGFVCRELYPNPDYRSSGDEDILIDPKDFALCHEAMLSLGMQVGDPGADIQTDYEVPYRKTGSPLHIELHRHLFPPESRAYGDFNRFFTPEDRKTEQLTVNGIRIATLECTDHLFYLICHAFKHFIHSGFGIRQLCDIALFARAYVARIDWERLEVQCGQIRAVHFTEAILKIAQVHLCVDLSGIPERWRKSDIDERAMLADVLVAGVYGKSTESRVHSSSMTLGAVADSKNGARSGLRSTLFPTGKSLEKRYPYLKKHPILLPVAWVSRMVSYGKEAVRRDNNAIDAMNIGRERIDLLKEYHIIG